MGVSRAGLQTGGVHASLEVRAPMHAFVNVEHHRMRPAFACVLLTPSAHLPICPSAHLPICPSAPPHTSAHLPICPSAHLPTLTHLPICPSAHPHTSAHLPICPSAHLPVFRHTGPKIRRHG